MVRHVLLVEPASRAGLSLVPILHQLGYLPRVLHNDRHTLAWARRGPADLVVLATEATASHDTCCVLKLHRVTNSLPIVQVLAGEGPLCLRAEPEASLRLPVTRAALAAALDRAVAVRAARLRDGILDEVNLWVPSDRNDLEPLSHLLAHWLPACGLSPFQAQQLNLATREVVANAIEWGHGYERSRLVGVHCRLDVEKVSILVRDSGPGFDRSNLPHAARPGDPFSHQEVRLHRRLREGGFGILMASGLADHLCYNDRGNESLLIKYLPTPTLGLPGRRPGTITTPAVP